MFTYSRQPHFYETDAMGIIHHGSYLRWMEEARVEFFRKSGLLKDASLDDINYPVLNVEIEYKKSVLFDDEFSINLSGKIEGARLHFHYEIRIKRFTEPVAFGKTVHVALDMKTKRPIRIPQALANLLP